MRRYKKDYSIDGWPVLDTELKSVLGTKDIVNILNDYESETTKLRAELEQAKAKIEAVSGDALTNFYKLVELKDSLPAIKADVIEAATNATKIDIEAKDEDGKTLWIGFKVACPVDSLKEYAEKVRRGEV